MTLPTTDRGTFRWPLCAGLLLASIVGCGTQDEIRRYKQPKLHRMLAAIVVHEDKAWFFKVSGPTKELGASTDAFQSLVSSVRFPAADAPEWDLPAGWKQESGSQMRFSTIHVPSDSGDEPFELTVIPLPVPDDPDVFVLQNVNRWRGQLRLRQIERDELASVSTQVELDGGLNATLLNLTGRLKSGGMAPFASASGMPSGPAPTGKPGITFDAPEGWEEGELVVSRGGISVTRDAVFNVAHDDKTAEVTVTSLPADTGMLLPNVNRWRGQAGLGPLSQEELDALDEINVHDAIGRYMELIGPSTAILGVIVEHDGTAWFIKLQGDHDAAVAERDNFKAFVGSIEFEH